jgi:hypothetical protein
VGTGKGNWGREREAYDAARLAGTECDATPRRERRARSRGSRP